MQNYVDTSNNSIAVGLVSLIIVFFLAKYIMENTYKEEDNNRVISSSIGAAIVISIICMILYKQMLMYRGSRNLLSEDFYN